MKKIIYSLVTLVVLSTIYSCKDDNLDPLQVNRIQKGKLLALRGTQLQNIYFIGKPGAEFFPRIATSADRFSFDAEYLAEDVNTLESIDVFVLKAGVGGATEKVLLVNVPFSSFKNDGTYPNPWVTVTVPLSDVLSKLGLSNTFPLSAPTINTLLTTYKFGINIWTDLKLKDGTVASADKVVASGLFQSNQFYPAQKLVYSVTDYCSYTASFWAGDYDSNEIDASGVYGPYNNTFTQDPTDPNKFTMNNFYDIGRTAFIVFTPSTNPGNQTVRFPAQPIGTTREILAGSTGTYDQCLGIININLELRTISSGNVAPFRYNLVKKP